LIINLLKGFLQYNITDEVRRSFACLRKPISPLCSIHIVYLTVRGDLYITYTFRTGWLHNRECYYRNK